MSEKSKEAIKCPNTRLCPCPNTGCANHKICCACVERHRGLGNLPDCLNLNKTEEE